VAVAFAWEMAVIVTVTLLPLAGIRLFAILKGALYVPVLEISPTVWLPPARPFTCHVTALDDPDTLAVKACVPKGCTVAVAGETTTLEGCVLPPPPLPLVCFKSVRPLQPATLARKTAITRTSVARRMFSSV
jgi:hypothetical protein